MISIRIIREIKLSNLLRVLAVRLNQKKLFCLVVAVLAAYVTVNHIFSNDEVDVIFSFQRVHFQSVERALQELMAQEKGTGCRMPNLDSFLSNVTIIDEDIEIINCAKQIDWVDCYLSECFVKEEIKSKIKNLQCHYKEIIYVNDDYYYFDKSTFVQGGDRYILNKSDHVKVSCSGTDVNSYGLFKSHWAGYKAGYRRVEHQVAPPVNSYNILILLFDSTSKRSFIENAPKSYSFLTEELKAIVMENYNIVGDGTSGALWPILTGHDVLEMIDSRRTPLNQRRVDPKPLLFSFLKERGYRTAYYEDMVWIGTFNWLYNGFEEAPADHYLRPIFQAEGQSYLRKWESGASRRYCFQDRNLLDFMINYSGQMFQLSGKKFCLSFSVSFTHEFTNTLYAVDADLERFLESFRQQGNLEDTVLFVMGDHGARFSKIRNTYQGKIEERRPFVSLVLPEALKLTRPNAENNLIANSKVLTTPFDVHTTILDILNLKEHRNKYKVPGADLERGISWFDVISENRSCVEAFIKPHWCACINWHNVSMNEPIFTKAAMALADFIDRFTENERKKCARRELVSIEWVLRRDSNANMLATSVDNKYKETYQTKIVLSPGKAIFEGTMEYNVKRDTFLISESDISRVNAYGDEPNCISHTQPHLNKYCYCMSTF